MSVLLNLCSVSVWSRVFLLELVGAQMELSELALSAAEPSTHCWGQSAVWCSVSALALDSAETTGWRSWWRHRWRWVCAFLPCLHRNFKLYLFHRSHSSRLTTPIASAIPPMAWPQRVWAVPALMFDYMCTARQFTLQHGREAKICRNWLCFLSHPF